MPARSSSRWQDSRLAVVVAGESSGFWVDLARSVKMLARTAGMNPAVARKHPLSVNSADEFGGRLLVVFDGHCGLCNRSVRWLVRRDREDRLRFVASESPKVARLLARHGFNAVNAGPDLGTILPETILVVRGFSGPEERVLVRSEAIMALLSELPRPWPAIAAALGWIPRLLRDLGYRLVARWRYRIWGRLESCPVPTAEERERFL